MEYRPFTIEVPQRDLDDLRARLGRTRWPNELQPQGWDRGTELEFLQELTRYWLEEYDWRVVEKSLNRYPHFITQAQGLELHFVHEKSGSADAVPIVLLHGWSDSFYRFSHLIELLTRTAEGEGGVVFDVVVPSLPGFDFSAQPGTGQAGATFAAASVAELMAGLGYEQYFVHGGDWGSAVAQEIARNHPDRVMGLHQAVDAVLRSERLTGRSGRLVDRTLRAVVGTVAGEGRSHHERDALLVRQHHSLVDPLLQRRDGRRLE